MKCAVEGCEKPVHARGYCSTHYGQIWHKGSISGRPIRVRRKRATQQISRSCLQLELDNVLHALRCARVCYRRAVGLKVRMEWKHCVVSLTQRAIEISEQIIEMKPEVAA